MAVTEATYIKRCKELVEEKLDWGDSREWKQRDYEFLSDLIYEKANIMLSLSTLKRVWNKDYSSLPRQSTLDALAIFLDYKSWNDFKKNQFEFLNQNGNGNSVTSFNKEPFIDKMKLKLSGRYAVIIVLSLISLWTLLFFGSDSDMNTSQNFNY